MRRLIVLLAAMMVSGLAMGDTFGRTTPGGTEDYYPSNTSVAVTVSSMTPSAGGTANYIWIYCYNNDGVANSTMTVTLYGDNSSHPYSMLISSQVVVVPQTAGWVKTADINYTMTASTQIYIAFRSNTSHAIRYTMDTATGYRETTTAGLTSPWTYTPGDQTSNRRIAAYIEYTPSGGGGTSTIQKTSHIYFGE